MQRASRDPTRLRRATCWCTIFVACFACASEEGLLPGAPDAAGDGPDAGSYAAPPVPPAVPAPPREVEPARPPEWSTCPSGWQAVASRCEPWPAGAPRCPGAAEARFPGDEGCARVGTACAEWPEVPVDRRVLYVRAGATAGDGTRAAPFATIAAALAVSRRGGVVAVAPGTYDGEVAADGVEIRGACAEGTFLTHTSAPVGEATVLLVGGAAIRDVSVTGRPGIIAGERSDVTIADVVVHDARDLGILVYRATAVLRDVVVRDTTRGPLSAGRGIDVQEGTVDGERIALVHNEEVGLNVAAGSTATVRALAIVDTQPHAFSGRYGQGVNVAAGGTARLSEVLIEGSHQVGALSAGALHLRNGVVRDTRPAEIDDTLGTGVEARGGGLLDLDRVSLERNRAYGILVAGAGTTATIADAWITDTEPDLAEADFGRGLQVDEGAEVNVARMVIDRAGDVGVVVSAPGSRLSAYDLTVTRTRPRARDGLFGRGLSVSMGGFARVQRAAILENRSAAVSAADPGSSLVAVDLDVRDTAADGGGERGHGLEVAREATAQLYRARFEVCTTAAITVTSTGAAVDGEDVAVSNTRPSPDGRGGAGIVVAEGARFSATRLAVTENREAGVVATRSAVLELADVRVEAQREQEATGTFGAGLVAGAGARVSLARAVLADNRFLGVLLDGPATRATLADVRVSGTRPQAADGAGGAGLHLQNGVEVVLRRAELREDVLTAVNVQTGAALELEDVFVSGTLTAPDGRGGRGLTVLAGATVTGERLRIESSREIGVVAFAEGAQLVLEDVAVVGTAPASCEAMGCAGAAGIALGAYEGGRVSIAGFELAHNAVAGVQVGPGGELDLARGAIHHNAIGANVLAEGFDLARLDVEVDYFDNARDLDAAYVAPPSIAAAIDLLGP